ncbi:MAG: TrkH family potassium uptake protein [Alphaproteobacteria bacterium]|jgi:trk system potassium uptake protein TrkH
MNETKSAITPALMPALMIVGLLLTIMGGIMLVPALIDFGTNAENSGAFFEASFITIILGLSFYLINRNGEETKNLSIKQVFIITGVIWVGISLSGALPFMLSDKKYSFYDAFFESVSGLTTTGATVFTGLQDHSKGILLWRAILNWVGGIGIVVLGMIVLPFLKVGGMQLFRSESSDKSEKFFPKTKQITISILICYLSLNLACAFFYHLAGMTWFDAITSSFSTVSTGGFANYDNSYAHFNNLYIELIAIVFMNLGSLPFLLYVQLVMFGKLNLFKDSQVLTFFSIQIFVILLVSSYLYIEKDFEFLVALRQVSFSVVSIMSTTGFATGDFSLWGPFVITLFFMLCFVGGCSGSTAGALKIFRVQVLFQMAKTHLYQLMQPHGIFKISLNKKSLKTEEVSSIMGFVLLYSFCFIVIAIALSFTNIDFLTAITASASMLANFGPSLEISTGPLGNYSQVSDFAKFICSVAMLLGRLEIYALLVLITPRFWRI